MTLDIDWSLVERKLLQLNAVGAFDGWEEGKHPRAENGQFGSGGGAAKLKAKVSEKKAARSALAEKKATGTEDLSSKVKRLHAEHKAAAAELKAQSQAKKAAKPKKHERLPELEKLRRYAALKIPVFAELTGKSMAAAGLKTKITPKTTLPKMLEAAEASGEADAFWKHAHEVAEKYTRTH